MSPTLSHWYELYGRHISRRDFLRVGRDVAGLLALASLPGDAVAEARATANPFTLGVASGDPVPDGVVLWTRLDAGAIGHVTATSVQWEVATDDRFRRIVRRGSRVAPAALGYSVHAEVDRLEPGREYWYRFMTGGQVSAVARTRTAPPADASNDRVRFAFISCQNYEHGYYTAFRHLAEEPVDAIVHLGDYIYEKRFASAPAVREHEAGEVFTLDQYRARYALYRADPDLQAAHSVCPWIVTNDDHEVANNWAGPFAEDTSVPQDQFLLRRAAAFQAYYEFMPLRRTSLPHGPWMQIYRRLEFGRLLRFHVLDTRQFRSDQACGDGSKPRCADVFDSKRTMMGPEQERWLAEGLRRSPARWNVLANQVMIAQTKRLARGEPVFSMDKWDGYVPARDRLMTLLGDPRVSNPVVVTGDIHTNWVADLKMDYDDAKSAVVGAEFVGTSMTSGGDGTDADTSRVQALNPHVKFFNARRGYVTVDVTPSRCTSTYRCVPYVSRPGAPIETSGTFVVEDGRRGVQAG
ncbi:MAG: alkaline phosphatase D family protein [Betaproteobacteria bacterium]